MLRTPSDLAIIDPDARKVLFKASNAPRKTFGGFSKHCDSKHVSKPDPKRLGISVTLSVTIVLPGEDGVSQSLYVPHVGTERDPGKMPGVLYVPPAGHTKHLQHVN